LANVKFPICAEVSFLAQAFGALRFFSKGNAFGGK